MTKEFEFTAKMRDRGVVTIPEPIREVLELEVGDFVTVKVRKPTD